MFPRIKYFILSLEEKDLSFPLLAFLSLSGSYLHAAAIWWYISSNVPFFFFFSFPRIPPRCERISTSQSDLFTLPESAAPKCFTSFFFLHSGAAVIFWHVTCCHDWRQPNPNLLCFPSTTTSTLLILNPLWCPTYHPCIVSSSVLRRAISLISA